LIEADMQKYLENEYYFRITYHDVNMVYPNVEVFLYVGTNLADDDVEETAYFQFIDSCAEASASVKKDEKVIPRMRLVTAENASEMVRLSELVGKLNAARDRLRTLKPLA
jgi:hypothetical protein